MPSIFLYLKKHDGDEWFFAATLFIYSFGELLGAIGFGYMHNYTTTRFALIISISFGLVGNIAYAVGDYLPDQAALWTIFCSRLF
jgi:hypothetical protein